MQCKERVCVVTLSLPPQNRQQLTAECQKLVRITRQLAKDVHRIEDRPILLSIIN
jgi:hypothetical protein